MYRFGLVIVSVVFLSISFNLLSVVYGNEPGTMNYGQQVHFDDISIAIESTPSDKSSHGYIEYRIWVTNHSSEQAHTVRLILPETKFNNRGSYIREITREGIVSPSSRVLFTLLQPPLPLYGNNLTVFLDGQRQSKVVPFHFNPHWSFRNLLFVLISRSVKGDFQQVANKVFEDLAKKSVPSTTKLVHENVEFIPSRSFVEDWSANWLGYTRYDGIVVTNEDLRSMPTSVQLALQRYVEGGGSLLVLGSWQAPESWRFKQEQMGFFVYYAGFGECIVTPSAEIEAVLSYLSWDFNQWLYIKESWAKTQRPWQLYGNVTEVNRIFPVVEDLRVPVRGLFLLILFFVVIIGPVNLFLISRKGKRIWLLWTVPAISLITCVAISAYALLAEGWKAYARTEGFTILDEVSHRATTIGWTAFYTPLTPGKGLNFSYETELTPVGVGTSYYPTYGGGTARTLDWTHGQHLATGWVTARVPAHFKIRKSETRRERLVVRKEQNGSLIVVNGLGADIHNLWLADKEGQVYSASNISAGEQALLIPAGGSVYASGRVDNLRQVFTLDWTRNFENLIKNPEGFLLPNCYIASLEASPFIEEGLQKVKFKKSRMVVYGIMNDK